MYSKRCICLLFIPVLVGLGSIKIWDFGAGQEIKCKLGRKSDEDMSITGLVYFKRDDDRVVLATGWNNRIRLLLVSVQLESLYVCVNFKHL